MPTTLTMDDLEATKAEHETQCRVFYEMSGDRSYDQWLMQVSGALTASVEPVQFILREPASRAADRVIVSVAAAHHDSFLHELASRVVGHVRKPPPGWRRTSARCNDYNLGLAIGSGGSRVKTVGGSWNWDCSRPLSGHYVLWVPPSACVAEAEDAYRDMPAVV